MVTHRLDHRLHPVGATTGQLSDKGARRKDAPVGADARHSPTQSWGIGTTFRSARYKPSSRVTDGRVVITKGLECKEVVA